MSVSCHNPTVLSSKDGSHVAQSISFPTCRPFPPIIGICPVIVASLPLVSHYCLSSNKQCHSCIATSRRVVLSHKRPPDLSIPHRRTFSMSSSLIYLYVVLHLGIRVAQWRARLSSRGDHVAFSYLSCNGCQNRAAGQW